MATASIPPSDQHAVRFARPDEKDAVYAFYDNERRPRSVYLRHRHIADHAVDDHRCLVITYPNSDKIAAVIMLLPMADGAKIRCEVDKSTGAILQVGRAYELVAALKDPNLNIEGACYPLLVGTMMVEMFMRGDTDLEGDILFGTVQEDKVNIRARLGGTAKKTSFNWFPFTEHDDLRGSSEETTSDPNKTKYKQVYYRAPLSDLYYTAVYLLKCHERGYAKTKEDGVFFPIDTTNWSAEFISTLEAITKNKDFFVPRKTNGLHRKDTRSWSKMAAEFRRKIAVPALASVIRFEVSGARREMLGRGDAGYSAPGRETTHGTDSKRIASGGNAGRMSLS